MLLLDVIDPEQLECAMSFESLPKGGSTRFWMY